MSANKLEKLMAKKQQLENQIQLAKAREKEQSRKDDTRRKILIGAVVLSMIKQKKFSQSELDKLLDIGLEQDRDRRLFGLGFKTETTTESKNDQRK